MLIFTGDINITDTIRDFGFGIGSKIISGKNPFGNIKKEPDDIWIGNFEGVLSSKSNKSGIFNRMMRLDSGYFKNGLIDYFAIANNHVMEHGNDAYMEMVENLSKISHGTFGENRKKSISFIHQGKNIGISAICFRIESHTETPLYWHNPSYDDIRQELSSLNNCDIKIAYIHWGVEYVNQPSTDQRWLAHSLIEMGYDLIIGMHPHVLQGYEIYNNRYIFYSLGNFVFNYPYYPGRIGAIVTLNPQTMEVIPKYVKIDDNGFPNIIEENCINENFRFSHLNRLINQNFDLEKYARKHYIALKEYRKYNRLYILKNIFRHKFSDIVHLSKDFILRKSKGL